MIDIDKFICSLIVKAWDSRSIGIRDIKAALEDQGLDYIEGAIKPIKKPVNFEEFPKEEQLKWYICIKPIPQKDGGFMPLFCEGEHATIEKIFDMLPELKNDTALFTEHFRKVTEIDLPKEKPSTIKFKEEPDIDSMVEDFWNNKDVIISSHTRGMVEEAYRQGFEDMYKRLKG